MADPNRDFLTDLLDRGLSPDEAPPPPPKFIAAVGDIRRRRVVGQRLVFVAAAAVIGFAALILQQLRPPPGETGGPKADPPDRIVAGALPRNTMSLGSMLAMNQGRSPEDLILPGEFHGMGGGHDGLAGLFR